MRASNCRGGSIATRCGRCSTGICRGWLTEPVDPGVRPFHDRPFRVLGTERFVRALIGGIGDPALRALPLTGAVDQFVDSTDALAHRARSRALAAALYGVRGP